MIRITYVGHATIQIEESGTRVVTDPMLRSRLGFVRRIAPPARLDGLRGPDAALISHAHLDHLDLPSLRRLAPRRLIVPPGYGRWLERDGFRDVTEVQPGDTVRIGALEVTAARAAHDGRRMPWSRGRVALAYTVSGAGRVFFAGDTELFDGLRDLADRLDVALIPIGGWGPRLGPGHMDPADAARAAALLDPRVAIPIHWGTYASPGAPWLDDPSGPARAFEQAAGSAAPAVDVRVLSPGASTSIDPAAVSSDAQ